MYKWFMKEDAIKSAYILVSSFILIMPSTHGKRAHILLMTIAITDT